MTDKGVCRTAPATLGLVITTNVGLVFLHLPARRLTTAYSKIWYKQWKVQWCCLEKIPHTGDKAPMP